MKKVAVGMELVKQLTLLLKGYPRIVQVSELEQCIGSDKVAKRTAQITVRTADTVEYEPSLPVDAAQRKDAGRRLANGNINAFSA